MDSRIIDVAIGLVLVFALTSMLVATLVEGLSTLLKKRGVVLKQAITSFLGDDQILATALLKHPLLVSLAEGAKNDDRKPSYIGADVMITSLVSYLTQYSGGIRPSSPAELVAAVKAGRPPGQGFQPVNAEFEHGLASLVHGVENDWQGYEKRLQAWYDSVTQRSIGWYKRWTNKWLLILGFFVAAAANINPIVIGPRLWNDAALRAAVVTAGQEASKRYEAQQTLGTHNTTASNVPAAPAATPGAAAPTNSTALAAAGAPTPMDALIQQPLPRRVPETEAVAESYARLVQTLTDLGTAARNDPRDTAGSARQQMFEGTAKLPALLNQARMPDDTTPAFLNKRADANASIDSLLARLKSLMPADTPPDITYQGPRRHLEALESNILKEREALKKSVENGKVAQKLNPQCDNIDDPTVKDLCQRMNDLSKLRNAGLPIGWSPPAWPDVAPPDSDAKCLEDAVKSGDKLAKACDHTYNGFNVLAALAGWLITGIAATLGAPFWFDLLGRLVRLRGSGPRIDGDSAKSSDAQPTTMSTSSSTAGTSTTSSEAMSDMLNEQEKLLSQSDIERIQRVLQNFGAQPTGTFDGVTRDAIKRWQAARNGQASGELSQAQITELLGLAQGGDDYAG